jgi:hypothetical protein
VVNDDDEQINILEAEHQDRQWIDGDDIRWRWSPDTQVGNRSGGWQYLNGATREWVTSIRPRIMGRGPYREVALDL